MKRLRVSLLLGLAVAITAGASPALGQARAQTRQGFWFNGGLGYGTLGCADCDGRTGSISGSLSVGATIGPKFLLGVGTTGWTKSENGATLNVGTLDARVRFYPSARSGFYLTGGFGLGSVSASLALGGGGQVSGSEIGLGVVLGLGYDIRIGNNVSLTPFWHGYAVQAEDANANVGQLGLSITVH
jgi:hypothetical protein